MMNNLDEVADIESFSVTSHDVAKCISNSSDCNSGNKAAMILLVTIDKFSAVELSIPHFRSLQHLTDMQKKKKIHNQ